ncbi:MAG TPA: MarR family transcriptional regulator [Vicinamibacterales bacterium]
MRKEQKASVAVPESLVGFWINRASRSAIRALDARLRPLGLAMSYLPVMRALADGGSCSQKELAQLARVEQPTMAEMLARMERDGVVRRRPNPDDKRATLISLAGPWRKRFPEASAILMEGERVATAGLSDPEKALLRELLQRVVRNIESWELPRPSEEPEGVAPTAGDSQRDDQRRPSSRKRRTS